MTQVAETLEAFQEEFDEMSPKHSPAKSDAHEQTGKE
jgi:hypothetical protein